MDIDTRALVGMRCLTINTWVIRVVIVSSVTTRIFFNSLQYWTVTISTRFNKDTCDLFMLCILLVCQLYTYCFIIVVRFSLLLFILFICLLFIFYSSFVPLMFHLIILFNSMFIVHQKMFNSDPGLYSRYFDPTSERVNKHHTSDCSRCLGASGQLRS
jgi:hypothetical protein